MKKIFIIILLGIISFCCKGQEVNFNFDIDFEKCIVIDSSFNDFSEWDKLKEIEDSLVNDFEFDWQTYYKENWINHKGIVFYPKRVSLIPFDSNSYRDSYKQIESNNYFYFSDTLSFFYYKDLFFISKKTIGVNTYSFDCICQVYKNNKKIDEINVSAGILPNKELNCYALYISCPFVEFTTKTKIKDFDCYHNFINILKI